ncbi:bifunctional OB-fold nucleic acid binding domain-containing protein/MaoC family dehydratase [Craterilacuibacter sinensis]|uniref:Acyl dehydratase n=1 Tax=Craterilacuibacter sinensis TaxID=2686017 RepID=A0A845BMC8_9NEIS|nr:MaoC/PaaZ C-terminal domain-containing protein [Craterilacuibacter sinensis]MXR37502.1 acyl dehydratase [Craterilacuibacter sinensis]
MSNKPQPAITDISRPYWDALKQHQIKLQQCNACALWVFFPRSHCPHCLSDALQWREVSGQGKLLTYTVARIPTLPDFADEAPQKLAVVELAEGVHLNTTLIGLDEDEICIGMAVKPVFDARGETTLLRFTGIDKTLSVIEGQTDEAAAETGQMQAKRQIHFKDFASLKALISDEFSPWSNRYSVTQDIINQFAALSGDDYWIHTDPERAKKHSPFGGTIAHGMLIQVLLSRLTIPLGWELTGFGNMANYGSNKLRFPSPVPAGSQIHGRARIKAVDEVKAGTQLTLEMCVHVVGQERPALINELIVLYMP